MVKNLPCNAGGVGLVPGWGAETPRAWEHLSPRAAAAEACATARESACHAERPRVMRQRSCMLQPRPDPAR